MTYTNEMTKALTMHKGIDPDGDLFDVMLAYTDENGVLYAPVNAYDGDTRLWRCEMRWTENDLHSLRRECTMLYKNLCILSRLLDKYDGTDKSIFNAINPAFRSARDTWMTYVRPLQTDEFDDEYMAEIALRAELSDVCDTLEREHADGEEWSDKDRTFYDTYRHIRVDEDEWALMDAYEEAIQREAEERIGKGFLAREVISQAHRICRLFRKPETRKKVYPELQKLKQALAIHHFAVSCELVG